MRRASPKILSSLAFAALALPLAGWWAFFSAVEPREVGKAVLSRLSAGTGLEVSAASVFRTGPCSAEARSLSVRSGGAVLLGAPVVAVDSGPGFAPPYRILCHAPVLAFDLASPPRFAPGDSAGFEAVEIRFEHGTIAVGNVPIGRGLSVRLTDLSGALRAGPGSAWSASGSFGRASAGRFEACGSAAEVESARIEFREWTDAGRILSSFSPMIRGVPVALPVEGDARGSFAVGEAGPAAVICSFRNLKSPLLGRLSGSGHASAAVDAAGPAGASFGGNVFLDALDWGCVHFERLSGVLEGGPGGVRFRSVSCVLAGGRATGGVSIGFGGGGTAALDLSLRGGDAARVPHEAFGSDLPLSGRISLDLSAEFGGIAGPGPASVRGQGSLLWSDAVLGYLPVVGGLDRYVSFHRGIAFRILKTDFNIETEGIMFRNGTAEGPLFNLELARPGAVRFDRGTDLQILIKRGHREERKFPVFTKLTETMKKMFVAPFEDMLALGIRVRGDYLDPEFDLVLPGRGK